MQQPNISLNFFPVDSAGAYHEDGERAPLVHNKATNLRFPKTTVVQFEDSDSDESMSLDSQIEEFTDKSPPHFQKYVKSSSNDFNENLSK